MFDQRNTPDPGERGQDVATLLRIALAMLDAAGESKAAVHVAQALDALGEDHQSIPSRH